MSAPIPEDLQVLYAQVNWPRTRQLIERIAAAEAERDEERQAHDEIGKILLPLVSTDDGTSVSAARNAAKELVAAREALGRMASAFHNENAKLRAENGQLSAPVSRHNEADGILHRYFITSGRQYRYTKKDATDLEALVNEWIAARKDAK